MPAPLSGPPGGLGQGFMGSPRSGDRGAHSSGSALERSGESGTRVATGREPFVIAIAPAWAWGQLIKHEAHMHGRTKSNDGSRGLGVGGVACPGLRSLTQEELGPGDISAPSPVSILHPPDREGFEWQLSTLVLASELAGANSMKGCNLGFPPPLFFPLFPGPWQDSSPGSGRSGLKTRVSPGRWGGSLGRTALKALFPIR